MSKETYFNLEIDQGDGNYSIEFGDFDLEVVLDEMKEEYEKEDWRIVKTECEERP